MSELLYTIKANTPKDEIIRQLREHPEIKFVSLVGIDLVLRGHGCSNGRLKRRVAGHRHS